MMPNAQRATIHGESSDLADPETPQSSPVIDGDRILIVDDDELIRMLLTSRLTDLGFSVSAAKNGEEAWSIIQEERIRLVLTDWDMPQLNGLGLLHRIRTMEGGESVYVIILTGRGNELDLVVGLDAGADDFLAKPFDSEELRVRIQAGQRIVRLQAAASGTEPTTGARSHRGVVSPTGPASAGCAQAGGISIRLAIRSVHARVRGHAECVPSR